MDFRAVELPPSAPGSLWLAGMPGRFESWGAFESRARSAGLSLVVCLTPRSEIAELSPPYHASLAEGTLPFRWLHLPMPNFGLPEDAGAFRQGVRTITEALVHGDAVMIHCAAGLGRTGSTAACILKALGLDTSEALQRVRDAGSNPQNARQTGLVNWF